METDSSTLENLLNECNVARITGLSVTSVRRWRLMKVVLRARHYADMSEQTYLKTKRKAARYLGVSLGSLERLMRSGLAYIRVGNLVRFRPEDLTDYIERRRVQRTEDAA